MNDLFKVRDELSYNLRFNSHFLTPSVETISHGILNLAQHNKRSINGYGKVKTSKNDLSRVRKNYLRNIFGLIHSDYFLILVMIFFSLHLKKHKKLGFLIGSFPTFLNSVFI